MSSRLTAIVIDCSDLTRLADFWRQLLDYEETERDEESVYLEPPGRTGPGLLLQRVPERKTVKNRLHLDLSPRDRDQPDEVERAKALGATEVDIGQGEVSWVVLADPEGNEFCILRGRKP